jgi:hydrogenase maturation protease
MIPRLLVAGVGNIFLGDDGFGVEVAQRLASRPQPAGVVVKDFGIRGVHLAYKLLDGYEALTLVDAVSRGGVPGTLYAIEPAPGAAEPVSPADAHDMGPEAVLGMLTQLGGVVGRVVVVGCEVAEIVERIGLSAPVARAVPEAVRRIERMVTEFLDLPGDTPGAVGAEGRPRRRAAIEH